MGSPCVSPVEKEENSPFEAPSLTSIYSSSSPTLFKTYVVSGVDEMTKSPHTLALLVLLILACAVQLTLDVLSDVFHATAGFPIVPVVATSCGLTFFSVIIQVALGTHLIPQFHMFAPVRGGDYFCAMHLSGYALSVVSVLLKLLLVIEFSKTMPRYGGMTIFGIMTVSGHFLLSTSLLYFVMPHSRDPSALTSDSSCGKEGNTMFLSKSMVSSSFPGGRMSYAIAKLLSPAARSLHFFPILATSNENNRVSSDSSPLHGMSSGETMEIWHVWDIALTTSLFAALLLSTSLTESWTTSRLAATLYISNLVIFLWSGFFTLFRQGLRLELRVHAEGISSSSPCADEASGTPSNPEKSSPHHYLPKRSENRNNGSNEAIKVDVLSSLLPGTTIYFPFRVWTSSLSGGIAQVWGHIFLILVIFSLCRIFAIGPLQERAIAWKFICSVCATLCISLHSLLLYLSGRQKGSSYASSSSSSPSSVTRSTFAGIFKEKEMRIPLLFTITAFFLYLIEQGLYGVKIYFYYAQWGNLQLHNVQHRNGFFFFEILSFIVSFLTNPIPLDSVTSAGVFSLQALLALLLFLLPPMTHCLGRLVWGQEFFLWNPFGGNRVFLVAQTVGWSSFSSALLMLLLHLSHPQQIHFFIFTSFLLFAQICIFVSLCAFTSNSGLEFRLASRKFDEYSDSALAEMTRPQRSSLAVRSVFSGELLLSLLFGIASFVLRSICDVGVHLALRSSTSPEEARNTGVMKEMTPSVSNPSFPEAWANDFPFSYFSPAVLLSLANVIALLSIPLAQLSMRHHVRLFFDLDRRSTGYVLLVAIGWTLYVLAGISCFMNLCMGGVFQFPFSLLSVSYSSSATMTGATSPQASREEVHPVRVPPVTVGGSTDRFFLYYTSQGFIFFVPLLLLISGFVVEIDNVLRSHIKNSRVKEAIQEMRRWGELHFAGTRSPSFSSECRRGEEHARADSSSFSSRELTVTASDMNDADTSVVRKDADTSPGASRTCSHSHLANNLNPLHGRNAGAGRKHGEFATERWNSAKKEHVSPSIASSSDSERVFYSLLGHLQAQVLPSSLLSRNSAYSWNSSWSDRDGSSQGRCFASSAAAYKSKDVDAVMDAASYITILTSIGSGSVLLLASVLVERGSAPLIPFIFAVSGLLVMTFSCVLLQYSYGHRLHDEATSRKLEGREQDTLAKDEQYRENRRKPKGSTSQYHYRFFMPFRGGNRFVFFQGVGWSAFTFCWFFMLAMILEGRVITGSFLALGFFTVVAQVMIMLSISFFDGRASIHNAYLAQNPEGLLAAATIIGTFCCSRIYDRAMMSPASRTEVGTSSTEGWSTSKGGGSSSLGGASPVSVLLSSLSFCIAVPIGILAIQRQREQSIFPPLLFRCSSSRIGDEKQRATADLSEDQSLTGMEEENILQEEGKERSYEDFVDEEDDVESSLEGKPMQHAIWHAFFPSTARKELGASSMKSSVQLASATSPLFVPSSAEEGKVSEGGRVDVWGALKRDGAMQTALGSSVGRNMQRENSAYERRRLYDFLSSLSRILAIFLVYLIPFILFYLAYTHHFHLPTFEYGVVALQSVGVSLSVLLFLPTVLPFFVWGFRPARNLLWYTSCAWFLWSISTVVVSFGLSAPLYCRPCPGWLWFSNLTLVSILSVIPYLQLTAFIMNTSFLGYFFHFYGYQCWYTQKNPLNISYAFIDFFTVFFWIWYCTRFFGKPHLTGRAYRPRARAFLRDTIFQGAGSYFNLKVIKVKPYVLEEERQYLDPSECLNPPEVDRSQASNQYLFSFHPHGVFPGTSLYGPCTNFWEDVVGKNDSSIVTTHAADVIFAVPILREIPLLVGAMSVSRRAIERSIRNGNSPLIITGGQSEMLLTKWSTTELHLVCHHLGFIKIALKNNVPIVPVISFSECNIMENIHALKIQRWFLKVLGFPLLVVPHGLFYLPLPTHLPLALVVGQPLRPYPGRNNPDDPSCVEELRARYFNHLQTIFYQYRSEVGYPNMVLYLHNGIYDPGIRVPPPGEKKD